MVHAMISHDVRDVAEWKKGFDAHEPARQAAGIRILNVFTNADAPNRITALSQADSRETLQGFFANPDLARIMEEGGVTSKPEVLFLNEL